MRKSLGGGLVLLAAVAGLSACAGGTSGSISGRTESCVNANCRGSIGKLSGSIGMDFSGVGGSDGDPILVVLDLSVGVGTVEAAVTGPDGAVTSVTVRPGQPAQLQGIGTVEYESLDEESLVEVQLTAVDGTAEDLEYSSAISR
jgi:hypothetical protein